MAKLKDHTTNWSALSKEVKEMNKRWESKIEELMKEGERRMNPLLTYCENCNTVMNKLSSCPHCGCMIDDNKDTHKNSSISSRGLTSYVSSYMPIDYIKIDFVLSPAEEKEKKCECGAESCGLTTHSSWCAKHG